MYLVTVVNVIKIFILVTKKNYFFNNEGVRYLTCTVSPVCFGLYFEIAYFEYIDQ